MFDRIFKDATPTRILFVAALFGVKWIHSQPNIWNNILGSYGKDKPHELTINPTQFETIARNQQKPLSASHFNPTQKLPSIEAKAAPSVFKEPQGNRSLVFKPDPYVYR